MDMPTSIAIGSNPIWLFGLFIFFLLIFHLWLIYWKPLSIIGWKYVDYIWLGVVAIGLIGESAQIRQTWYTSVYDNALYRSEDTLGDLKQQTDFLTSSTICKTLQESDYSPDMFNKIRAEYKFACTEIAKINREIMVAHETRKVGFMDLQDTSKIREKLTEPVLIAKLNELELNHQKFIDALNERAAAEAKLQTTKSEYLLRFISPFLLVFSLALRLTKVTADIRISKQHKMM